MKGFNIVFGTKISLNSESVNENYKKSVSYEDHFKMVLTDAGKNEKVTFDKLNSFSQKLGSIDNNRKLSYWSYKNMTKYILFFLIRILFIIVFFYIN